MGVIPLSKEDEALLELCREIAAEIAATHINVVVNPIDIDVLQSIVDNNICKPDDEWGLQSLGVALGDILCLSGFHWAVREFKERRNLVVTFGDSGLIVSAPVLIQKRVSAGEDCDIRALVTWALGLAAEKMKNDPHDLH